MFNIVLLEPEKPDNTGNIGRTCVATGSALHLIYPLGFNLTRKNIHHAGLDYWERLKLFTHDSYNDFLEYYKRARVARPYDVGSCKQVCSDNRASNARPYDVGSCKQVCSDDRASNARPYDVGSCEQVCSDNRASNARPYDVGSCEQACMGELCEPLGNNCLGAPTLWLATTKAHKSYTDVSFKNGDFIMFGKESAGIPEEILANDEEHCIRIPMKENERSLNLSNSVAIVLYEALRQNSFSELVKKGELHKLKYNN